MSVSQIGEGCAKQIKDNLGDVIGAPRPFCAHVIY